VSEPKEIRMAPKTIQQKREELEEILRGIGSVLVAYSGGVDSSYLLYAAATTLGAANVAAATARSPIYVEQDDAALGALPARLGVRHIFLQAEQLADEEFVHNPQDRCYYCKRSVLGTLAGVAREQGVRAIVEGSNMDDLGDYRPGMRAVKERGARSPLQEAGLAKAEIRALAKEAGLANWDKPAESCLAARFPYGARITPEALDRVRRSEAALKAMGFPIVRVRDYGIMARIEVPPEEIGRLTTRDLSEKVVASLRAAGYQYISVDLQGYRRGSLNETLPPGTLGAVHG
jgi:uncharacterized protein